MLISLALWFLIFTIVIVGANQFLNLFTEGVFWAQFRGPVAPSPAIYAPETRTAAQRETARRHRAALEYSEIVPQRGPASNRSS